MRSSELIAKLREQTDAIRGMGATSLYLFGSASRDEATGQSDIDLFVDYEKGRFSLIDLVGLKQHLEETMSTDIDITTRDSLNPMLKDAIERSAIRVF